MSDDQPYAEVTRVGRWTYNIVIHDGICISGPAMGGVVLGWNVWGRERAERKAAKVLAEYVNRQEPERFLVRMRASRFGARCEYRRLKREFLAAYEAAKQESKP